MGTGALRRFAQCERLSGEARDGLTLHAIAEFSPYANEPERTRWIEGLTKALDD